MCGFLDNCVCVLVICVLALHVFCIVWTVLVLFRLCIFYTYTLCFDCTIVRTTVSRSGLRTLSAAADFRTVLHTIASSPSNRMRTAAADCGQLCVADRFAMRTARHGGRIVL